MGIFDTVTWYSIKEMFKVWNILCGTLNMSSQCKTHLHILLFWHDEMGILYDTKRECCIVKCNIKYGAWRSEQTYFSYAFWKGNVVWYIMKRECCIIMYDMKHGAVSAKHIQLSWIVKWHNMERECCIIIRNMKYGATEVWAIVMDVCTARIKSNGQFKL